MCGKWGDVLIWESGGSGDYLEEGDEKEQEDKDKKNYNDSDNDEVCAANGEMS